MRAIPSRRLSWPQGKGQSLYTVGFGSPEGEPVPEYDEQGNITGNRRDAQGRVITSKLDEAALQHIAENGGGRYFRAAERGAIAGLVDEIQSFQDPEPAERVRPEEG